ncbi:2Fe-2S iron-sulfur cluster binding domain-containing protein [Aeromicrobium sp. SMF47]|uniref:2Fe-2S iron-sulfur cluster binding domain-containing protein n=1 Tax=Aeromicrobium yanjiei TaxID=2662028 RepID=A0A5Q2ME48_9ACTN|nr:MULTISPECIES: ferredoxin reductase [Aeromicrobium]MRJ75443.1 2Fe-2S iron-sulfur cluster binding domain-containing protein [Aeromicrobium yanjiei]MRK02501.1 2Fe-2S iron-sulfur cluster binding domain-containing protein [Aeromicrobium sp. S22]QGG40113.1 2Fe-2S iron-sulfur cluster binding domain-containing protein [Aeromicrobium yanjiei]
MTSAPIERTSALRRIRHLGKALTTPLSPDDYLALVNPLWSQRELRGRVEKVVPETENAATLVIRPGWGWRFDHSPGQYIGIGVELDGRFHWRSYSLSSTPLVEGKTVSITVKAMPEGFLSDHLVNGLEPGTIVRLASPQGDFVIPDPPPDKMLFLVGGSGITPVMSILRTLDRRGTLADATLIYSARFEEDMMFLHELRELAGRHEGFTFHERFTDVDGILTPEQLDDVCHDWMDRETWACGPAPMLDAFTDHFQRLGREDHLHVERFTLATAGTEGAGGTVTFGDGGPTVEVDGATTLLEAGEKAGVNMLFGCRMGICHTCDVPLAAGRVRDLRSGDEHGEPNEYVQTCISVAVGDCTLAL